jgi:catechol 2,3-dioxygenase-like lactoylglutathione lyase family enzyme
MSIELNHTVVAASDAEASARWVAEILGLPEPEPLGHFWQVTTANGVGLDFATVGADAEVVPQHYAFLISEEDFDSVYGKIQLRDMDHWADPRQAQPQQINRRDGGRGVYFLSNDGHYLEVITRPYGSGS